MKHPTQLALPFPHQPHFTRSEFLAAGSNEDARSWLCRTADWPGLRLAVWGQSGCGKTHLLHVWAGEHDAVLLSGAALDGFMPDRGAVAIDDADACVQPTSLLHLLNLAEEAGCPVLLAGRLPPARWATALPDLASRLRAINAVQIQPPGEGLLRALLARLLAERQLAVPEAIQEWLLLRLPRTPAAMREAATRLDQLALARGGPISRSIAAQILAGHSFEEDLGSACGDASRCGSPLL